MNVLVLGTGAREHALAWKLKQSKYVTRTYLHPGNPGTKLLGYETLSSQAHDAEHIAKEAKQLHIELIVIGPEMYLASGYAEKLRQYGFHVLGPDSSAAKLETSKAFAKEFMQKAGVPTAAFVVVDDFARMLSVQTKFPIVLKLDGLAAGKGVVIANSQNEVIQFAEKVYNTNTFGKGPHRVVFEEFIPGKEVSFIGLCDGNAFYPLSTATDYKRVGDGDLGPNTGGMGVVSPSPYENELLLQKIQRDIVDKVLTGMKAQDIHYRGVLYIGIMVTPQGNPMVLEFNTRFGDPETQALLLRLESDLAEYSLATAKGELSTLPPLSFSPQTSLYVVCAAEGYPGKVKTNDEITGWDAISPNTELFFSGVTELSGKLFTNGGRVLGVGTLAKDVKAAQTNLYKEITKIKFNGMHYRSDIGKTSP